MSVFTTKRLLSFLLIALSSVFFVAHAQHAAYAFETEIIDDLDVKNDFILEPGKMEFSINPGETILKTIYITSRIPSTTKFRIQVEDIKGSNDPTQPVVILDNERGPYSAKDFITPEISEFSLKSKERIAIPVVISIPKDVSPGGYYSTVLISNEPTVTATGTQTTAQATRVISRVGTLLFIRVNGEAVQSGQLEDLRIKGPQKFFYPSGPFTFEILFHNTGNVHLVPYGSVIIKNTLGKMIAELPVDGYFSLPNSLRYRDVLWNQGILFGRYTATVNLNRGYGDIVDTKTVTFWVLPWKFLITVFAIVFIIILILVVFLRTFEIKKK